MNNKLIPLVITMVVGIILAGSVLMPVLNDAQKDLGTPTTKINAYTYGPNMSVLDGAIEITADADDVIEINGESVTLSTHAPYFMSDNCIVYGSSTYFICYIVKADETTTTTISDTFSAAQTFTFSAENGVISVSNGTNTATTTYSWAYAYDASGVYSYVSSGLSSGAAVFYWSSMSDFVFCGDYSTGDNDTFYTVKDGVCKNAAGYEMGINIPEASNLAAGTTDINEIVKNGVKISIGDEEFTPYNCLIKNTIEGHATSGASYSLLGAIPVLVIVALIMGAVGMVVVRRND